MFKRNDDPRNYFGKIMKQLTYTREDGLDWFIRDHISRYYKGDKLTIGILSATRHHDGEYYSGQEHHVFDYYEDEIQLYVNHEKIYSEPTEILPEESSE